MPKPPRSELEQREVASCARPVGLIGRSEAVAIGVSLFRLKADPSTDIKDVGKSAE